MIPGTGSAEAVVGAPPEVLQPDECWTLVRSQAIARLALVVDGWPIVLPVNYVVDGTDIVIRTAPGSAMSAARLEAQVALEVDVIDELYRSGWSVLVLGTAAEITEPSELRHTTALPLRPWAAGQRSCWIRVRPVQITGRRVPRAWHYPGPLP